MLSKDLEVAIASIPSKHSSLDADDLLPVFIQVSNLADTHFIILDGLDECRKKERAAVLRVLRGVSATARSTVKLFLSCREDIGDDIPRAFPSCYRQSMSRTHIDTDIAGFVADAVQAKVDDGDLAVGDPALVRDICTALVEGADGM
jgi:hypothetical protein